MYPKATEHGNFKMTSWTGWFFSLRAGSVIDDPAPMLIRGVNIESSLSRENDGQAEGVKASRDLEVKIC